MEFRRAYDPMRALGGAWRCLRRAPAPLLLGGTVLLLLDGGYGVSYSLDWDQAGRIEPGWWILIGLIAVVGTIFGLLLWAFECLLGVGFAGAVERALTSGEQNIGDLVMGRGRWVSMMISRVLMYALGALVFFPGALVAVGAFFLGVAVDSDGLGALLASLVISFWVLPVVYVWLGIALTPQAVALEGLRPTEALARSWRLVQGQRLRLLLYYLVLWVVGVSGLLLCCVGVFGTMSLVYTTLNESYLRLVRSSAEQESWWVSQGPPDQVPDASSS